MAFSRAASITSSFTSSNSGVRAGDLFLKRNDINVIFAHHRVAEILFRRFIERKRGLVEGRTRIYAGHFVFPPERFGGFHLQFSLFATSSKVGASPARSGDKATTRSVAASAALLRAA
jgi:hypothetical protein